MRAQLLGNPMQPGIEPVALLWAKFEGLIVFSFHFNGERK